MQHSEINDLKQECQDLRHVNASLEKLVREGLQVGLVIILLFRGTNCEDDVALCLGNEETVVSRVPVVKSTWSRVLTTLSS